VKENNINAIITFDQYGVSSHPNHIACSLGVSNMAKKEENNGIKIFKLTSVNFIRKYISILDLVFCMGDEWLYVNFKFWKNIGVMSQHWSQFVWFRWLFIAFGRYSFVNT